MMTEECDKIVNEAISISESSPKWSAEIFEDAAKCYNKFDRELAAKYYNLAADLFLSIKDDIRAAKLYGQAITRYMMVNNIEKAHFLVDLGLKHEFTEKAYQFKLAMDALNAKEQEEISYVEKEVTTLFDQSSSLKENINIETTETSSDLRTEINKIDENNSEIKIDLTPLISDQDSFISKENFYIDTSELNLEFTDTTSLNVLQNLSDLTSKAEPHSIKEKSKNSISSQMNVKPIIDLESDENFHQNFTNKSLSNVVESTDDFSHYLYSSIENEFQEQLENIELADIIPNSLEVINVVSNAILDSKETTNEGTIYKWKKNSINPGEGLKINYIVNRKLTDNENTEIFSSKSEIKLVKSSGEIITQLKDVDITSKRDLLAFKEKEIQQKEDSESKFHKGSISDILSPNNFEISKIIEKFGSIVKKPDYYSSHFTMNTTFKVNNSEQSLVDIIPEEFSLIDYYKPDDISLDEKVSTEEGLKLIWNLNENIQNRDISINYLLKKKVKRKIYLWKGKQVSLLSSFYSVNEKSLSLDYSNNSEINFKTIIIEDEIPLEYIVHSIDNSINMDYYLVTKNNSTIYRWIIHDIKPGFKFKINYQVRSRSKTRKYKMKIFSKMSKWQITKISQPIDNLPSTYLFYYEIKGKVKENIEVREIFPNSVHIEIVEPLNLMPETINKDNFTILHWNIPMQENIIKFIMKIRIDSSYYSIPPLANVGEEVKLTEHNFNQEEATLNFINLYSTKEL